MISIIIPAAGLSRRMGTANKLLLKIDGISMIERVVRLALDQDVEEVIAVTGNEREKIECALEGIAVRIVVNPDFEKGMGSSLIAGVEAADATHGYLIWPADMPFVASKTVRDILNAYEVDAIIVPAHEGQRGHPVLFGSSFRRALMNIPVDNGARSILKAFPKAVHDVEVHDAGIHRDMDTPSDIENAGPLC